MIVGGQTEARAQLSSTIIDYHEPFDQAQVVQRLDNTTHRINHYPADSVVCFVNTYPLNSGLSGG